MQRVIKFRGYDPINNKIISWDGMQGWAISGLESPNIMQFTGLHDKNGKEIYEGDILKYTSRKTIGDFFHRRIVFWDDEKSRFALKKTSGGIGNLTEKKSKRSYEVIGNVYQNSELLK